MRRVNARGIAMSFFKRIKRIIQNKPISSDEYIDSIRKKGISIGGVQGV